MSVLSAITGGIGSVLDYFSAEKNRDLQEKMAEKNIALQKEFAQTGIRWKVEDAKAAGIHPIYAMGGSGTSFSPVSIGSLPDTNFGEAFRGMGQDLTRPVNATRTLDEREQAFTDSSRALELEGKKLDNDIKRASLASSVARVTQTPNPPMPGNLVPAADDPSDRKPLFYGGTAWGTDPQTSSAQDFEDRYGDEGPAQWAIQPMIAWQDYLYNYPRVEGFIEGMMRPRTFDERFRKWRKMKGK